MTKTAIWWVRRDMRLKDNPALSASVAAGAVVPVFVLDQRFESLGAAPLWRLEAALKALSRALEGLGSRLILRRGDAQEALQAVISETGATEVHWNRLYDPESIAIDTALKAGLRAQGYTAQSHAGHLLHEPMAIKTKTGDYYKVFTPFWRAMQAHEVAPPRPAPGALEGPGVWPASETLAQWRLGAKMQRGAQVVAGHTGAGEAKAWEKLETFLSERAETYAEARDNLALSGTSDISDNLAYGEISARSIWDSGQKAAASGTCGLEPFLRQIAWRDFAHHLMFHTPHILSDNWRPGWETFPWSEATDTPEVLAWKLGRTGVDFVDAAMRELWVTGKMHNRARMVAASYLTKHMMVHWRVGERWFADQLIDYDPANNAMGWQWVAGSGPDASPYFRIFNPETQLKKFDPDHAYVRRWLAEGQRSPPQTALQYYDAIYLSQGAAPNERRGAPIVGLKEGRERALAAYSAR
jgi:deoxyribodipyrimidine photo-lyase